MSASANITKFLAGMAKGHAKARAAALKAVDVYGEKVLGDAQQLCPVDTGALVASAKADPAVLEGEGVTKRLSFNTDYAAIVHERLDVKHPVGQAKYLSTAIERNRPKFNDFVAGKVKAALEGGA